MDPSLKNKVQAAVQTLRQTWPQLRDRHPFVAFSTGKDSLALAAMLYEAVEDERPECLYVHHELEFPENLQYLEALRGHGFSIQILQPFLEYFELMDRGMGFLTRTSPWCIPMLIGTGLIEWLQYQGARSPRDGVMFRGMSGSEYSHKFHAGLELYEHLDMPTFNPLLGFTKEEIIAVITRRYGLPLNPIYEPMGRTYCICCYCPDAKRQAYSAERYPDVCGRYYGQIEVMLFDSGLIDSVDLAPEHRTKEEKLGRHGFIHWRRTRAQDRVGAIRRKLPGGVLAYAIRDPKWMNPKHLHPVDGQWTRKGNEIRFWNVPDRQADALIKRMINCLECGFCAVECFPCRSFDRRTKSLRVDGCIQCGKCARLEFCMGWRYRFWRRVVVEAS